MDKRKKKLLLLVVFSAAVLLGLIAAGITYYVNRKHPVISLLGDATVLVEYGDAYSEPGAEARSVNSHGKTTALHYKVTGTVGQEPGMYVLTYSAGPPGDKVSVTRTVIVQDSVAPEIELKGDAVVTLTPEEAYEEEGYSATDNHDGDISARVTVTHTDDGYLYEVTDSAGNTASVLRSVHYVMVPPTIGLVGEDSLSISASVTGYADPGYHAEDSLDGDLTSQVTMEGYVNTHCAGSYTLTYRVTDSEGLSASCAREVIVTPVQAPAYNKPEGKVIYLTFDDGPSENTEDLLEILDKYEVKATWFVTARHPEYFDQITEIAKKGHTVAIHTASHDYDAIYADEEAYFRDFREVQELLLEETGLLTTLFRFPGGSSNTVSKFNPGIMTALTRDANDCGLTYFDWNVTGADTASNANRSTVVANIKEGVQQQDISVVLQHDTQGFSVEAVEEIIVWALEKGYTFLPLDATSPTCHHDVLN